MASGKLLEQVVTAIEFAHASVPGTQIQRDVKVRDRDGDLDQIDVLVVVPVGRNRTVRIGIECRDSKSRVKKDELFAYKTKCEDARIDKKVIVTKKGYQKTAQKKARAYGIEILTLSDLNEPTIHAWSQLTEIGLHLNRYRISSVGINIPDAPPDIKFDECKIVDRIWNETSSLNDFITSLVNVDPPPFENVKTGDRKNRQIYFDSQTVLLIWQEREYPVKTIDVEIEFYTELHSGPRVRSGCLAEADTGKQRANVISYQIPIQNAEAFLTIVQSASDKDTQAIADFPAEIVANPVRSMRLRTIFKAMTVVAQHEELPLENIDLTKSGYRVNEKIHVLDASMKINKTYEGSGNVHLERVYLSDKRTSLETASLILLLLSKSAPPLDDLSSRNNKRLRSTIQPAVNSIFVTTTGGFLPVTQIVTDVIFNS